MFTAVKWETAFTLWSENDIISAFKLLIMLCSLNIHLYSIQITLLLFSAGSVQVFDGLQTTVKTLECYAFKNK